MSTKIFAGGAMPNDVSTQRNDISEAVARGQLPRDLLGGTVTMQEAGERYIYKNPQEPKPRWDARVKSGVLLNQYKRTVEYLSGQVFSRPASLSVESGDVGDVYQAMADDVDLQGNSLSVWSRGYFEDAINAGASWVLVEYPQLDLRTEGNTTLYMNEAGEWVPKTAESDAQNGWRPYFCIIPQANVLGYRYDTVNGKKVLTQFRFMEKVVEEHGQFDTDDVEIEQVRVLEPGTWQIWRENKDSKTQHKEWYLYDEGTTSIGVIPAHVLRLGEPNGESCAYPVLEDLAHLNRLHWQGTVDHVDLMSWGRRPIWLSKGVYDSEEKAQAGQQSFSPGLMINSLQTDCGLENVGIDSNSISASREDLDNLKVEMSLWGLQNIMLQKSGTKTATEAALNASEVDSTLKAWAVLLMDALDMAFMYAGMWIGDENQPRVSVNTEFHLASGLDMDGLKIAVEAGIISKEDAFEEMRRRGFLPDSADWVETKAAIENEARGDIGPNLPPDLAQNMLGVST